MKKHYIYKIISAYRNRALFSTLKWAVFKLWPIHWIKNRTILRYQQRDVLYKKLCGKYRHIIANAEHPPVSARAFPKKVWWCWLQGYDQAPELVKSCYESLRRNMEGYKIHIITLENLSEYVDLPEFVAAKFNSGIISAAHYSDIIRLELLIRYGGIWIDSTVLCTDNAICAEIEKAPLFVYQSLMNGSNTTVASNWLISSLPSSPVLCLTRALLLEYWKRHNMPEDYFLFHLFFAMALRRFPEIWRRIPPHNNVSPHMLSREINSKYSDERYAVLKRTSSFHKLSNKTSYTQTSGTFYDVLIRNRQF